MALAVVMVHPVVAQQSIGELEACIPSWDGFFNGSKTRIVASTTEGDKEYHLLHLYQIDSDYANPLVVSTSTQGGDCQQEYLDISGSNISLPDALGGDVGQRLVDALYERDLERLGKEGLQQKAEEVAGQKDSQVIWRKDDVTALKKLNITIPSNVAIEVTR